MGLHIRQLFLSMVPVTRRMPNNVRYHYFIHSPRVSVQSFWRLYIENLKIMPKIFLLEWFSCIFALSSMNAFIDYCSCLSSWIFLFFLKNIFLKDFIYFLWEREKEGARGRETSMCDCLLCAPYWGPGLQPRHVSWLGIKLVTLWFTGWMLNPLSHTSQFFKNISTK